jgi:3,4-dihydroxy-2-butanone 4-phosphate synthase
MTFKKIFPNMRKGETLVKDISIDCAIRSLKNGQLIIIVDDMADKTSFLMGLAENVSPQNVNIMTKIGKGLTYVCITESMAKQLNLPLMVADNTSFFDRDFTVSVDYKTTTTGISVFERAQTIRAFATVDINPEDFRKPGHVFPLVGKEKGLLQRVDVVEASIDLAKFCSSHHTAYISEILNVSGDVATKVEVEDIAKTYGIKMITLSEILKAKSSEVIHAFSATVIEGKKLGNRIGFPTANLDFSENHVPLNRGVYGVKVLYGNIEHLGMMNVGVRPTFNKKTSSLHFGIHIFDFDKQIYGESLKVDVCFYIRPEISFPTVDQLVMQIHKDKKVALNRFELAQAGRAIDEGRYAN